MGVVLAAVALALSASPALADTYGTSDQCQGKTATASTPPVTQPTYGAPRAVDGNESTFWDSATNSLSEWIAVDLGTALRIGQFRLNQYPGYHPTSENVQWSNDQTSWTQVATQTITADDQTFTFPAATARYWRLTPNSWAGSNGSDWAIYTWACFIATAPAPSPSPSPAPSPSPSPSVAPSPSPAPSPSASPSPSIVVVRVDSFSGSGGQVIAMTGALVVGLLATLVGLQIRRQ